MFKNMKIEINEQQPLDAVVAELERLGYAKNSNLTHGITWIVCFKSGFYSQYRKMNGFSDVLTTLAQLKEMKNRKVKIKSFNGELLSNVMELLKQRPLYTRELYKLLGSRKTGLTLNKFRNCLYELQELGYIETDNSGEYPRWCMTKEYS